MNIVETAVHEASMPFGKSGNTKGLTFGFEAEFVVNKETFGDHADIDDISEDELANELGTDEDEMNEKFGEWKEETGNADATLHDWINTIGITQWWNEVRADGNYWYTVTDDRLIRYPTWASAVDLFADDIINYLGYDIVAANNEEHEPNKGDYSRWFIENDPSVGSEDTYAFEVVSPKFDDYNTFIAEMTRFLNWIVENYDGMIYTDSSTGLHINIGMEGAAQKIDALKLLLFSGEKWVTALWRGTDLGAQRLVGPVLPKLLASGLPASTKEASRFAIGFFKKLDDKAFAFNMLTLINRGYVEFRPIGNKNYEKNIPEVIKHVNRFVQIINIASNPESYKQEYAKKLGNLITGGPMKNQHQNAYERAVSEWMDQMNLSESARREIMDENGHIKIKPGTFLSMVAFGLRNPGKMPKNIFTILLKSSGLNAATWSELRDAYDKRLPWSLDDTNWEKVKPVLNAIFSQ